ncbi:MAG: aldo/keto reductase [Boseongicola sp.]|nr:aldo/keto reductase [Boseongicola sp.]MDD9978889.1 aldo/keto reductase [Boseongicola sp.]
MSIYSQKNHQRAFGTYPLTGDALLAAIECAAKVGYRAFDTAQMYQNEAETGEGLSATGISRDDLCITTKVNFENFTDDRFLHSVERSLKELRVDYVDALLLHWPPADGNIAPSLKMLQQAYDEGLTRNIGVSNYTVAMLREAVNIVDAPLATNQVEFHPLLNQDKLLAGANETGVPLSAYCSVARGEVFKRPIFGEIGQTYSKSAGQVVLRWILQKGVSVNVMSTNPMNIEANYDIMDFTLSHVDMARIDAMTHENHRIVSKDIVPFAPDFD